MADKQTKRPETPETRAQLAQNEAVEFKKDVRFLWLYGSIFCIVLLVLIGGSAVVQRKMHRQLESYQTQAENAETTSQNTQSRLRNIQDENTQLKQTNEALTFENDTLKAAAETDGKLLQDAETGLTELTKLVQVGQLSSSGHGAQAAALLETIDADKLPAGARQTYEYYKERLK